MIKVVANFFVQENKINEFIQICKELVEMSRKEIGCINYSLYQDNQNSKTLTMIEQRENREALDTHLKSKHFAKIIPMLETLISKEIDINIYTKII
ncbi:putative quinol monooxygenase [Clostridium cadaveris]|uniref:putative quinol monooxygenase n=1 Tax=Clostridium cadaveris TaxID=1529 RepID=UPI0004136169|nr:putative quinol monooxygenase [Clostridium cadaveris]